MYIRYAVLGFEPTTFEHESHPITTRKGKVVSNSFLKLYIN